ncbi:hypothetical protein FH966_09545 [Lentibacillus cibarius]|uniref:Uncharacterized protein n=1 Tax=Lentibacillus cibarius TaxID=2583219 RepID=A0A549YJ49_9BACI|nr:hypothetical protein [Lentibacillus cibarius]TRM11909.1 hypothetical protein FH966_09545 [Lentibacillus cibarius]
MKYAVQNCFHWIGFHIVNYLLEKGYRVDGMDDITTDKKEHLSMFVGRNELFRHVPYSRATDSYDVTMFVDDYCLKLNTHAPVTIQLPLLFGEWMPMNDKGIFVQNEFISFDSKQFLRQAVYIDQFLNSMQQWIHATRMPAELVVRSERDKDAGGERPENLLHIRSNETVEEYIQLVKAHYARFKDFY